MNSRRPPPKTARQKAVDALRRCPPGQRRWFAERELFAFGEEIYVTDASGAGPLELLSDADAVFVLLKWLKTARNHRANRAKAEAQHAAQVERVQRARKSFRIVRAAPAPQTIAPNQIQ